MSVASWSQTFNAPNNQGAFIGSNYGTQNNYISSIAESPSQQDPIARLFLTDPDIDRSNLSIEKGDRVPGTCEWIFEHTLYQNWLVSSSSSLWLLGGPGKGKTMVALHVVESLLSRATNDDSITVLYFFCSDQNESRGNAIALLRGIMFQLIKRHPHLRNHCIDSLRAENHLQTLASFGELWRMFLAMVKDARVGEIFCVVDAVDECNAESRSDLLKKLFALAQNQSSTACSNFKLFGISRNIASVCFSPDRVIRMDSESFPPIQSDIEAFIEHKIKQLNNLDDFSEIADRVRTLYAEKAEGTFLWVGLMSRQLESAETIDEALDMLERAPSGLHNLYKRLLERIQPQPRFALNSMLRWLLVARRPMTTKELAAAMDHKEKHGRSPSKILQGHLRQCQGLCRTIQGDCIRYEYGPAIRDAVHNFLLNPPQQWTTVLVADDASSFPGLQAHLSIDSSTIPIVKYVQRRPSYTADDVFVIFCHQSVKEFFLGNMEKSGIKEQCILLDAQELEWRAAQRCLDYISSSVLSSQWVCLNDPAVKLQHPFLEYSTMFWTSHAQHHSGPNMELVNTSHPFLDSTTAAAGLRFRWMLSNLLHSKFACFLYTLAHNQTELFLLHMAARFGLDSWLEKLLPNDLPASHLRQSLCHRDEAGRDALMHACEGNSIGAARVLLCRGAPPSYEAYAAAIKLGCDEMLKMLIAHGQIDTTYDSMEGHVWEELYELNMDLTPLVEALLRQRWGAVQLLLESGARISNLSWCLTKAIDASEPNSAVIQHFVQHSQAQLADFLEAVVVVSKFSGADADAALKGLIHRLTSDHSQKTKVALEEALRNAAGHGLEESVSLLLSRNVDFKAPDGDGITAVVHAVGSGHQKIACILQSRGAELHNLDKVGGKMLCCAAENNNIDGVKLLLNKGVHVDSRDAKHCTSLMLASLAGHTDMASLLLDNGAKPNIRGACNETALHWASVKGCLDIVKLLVVSHHAQVNLVEGSGRTALHCAAKAQHKGVLEFLLRNGGQSSIRDNDGLRCLDVWKTEEQRRRAKDRVKSYDHYTHMCD